MLTSISPFSAMPQMHHRDPGVIGLLGAQVQSQRPYYGLIADGIHVHPNAVRLAYDCHPDGAVLVTDGASGTAQRCRITSKSNLCDGLCLFSHASDGSQNARWKTRVARWAIYCQGGSQAQDRWHCDVSWSVSGDRTYNHTCTGYQLTMCHPQRDFYGRLREEPGYVHLHLTRSSDQGCDIQRSTNARRRGCAAQGLIGCWQRRRLSSAVAGRLCEEHVDHGTACVSESLPGLNGAMRPVWELTSP